MTTKTTSTVTTALTLDVAEFDMLLSSVKAAKLVAPETEAYKYDRLERKLLPYYTGEATRIPMNLRKLQFVRRVMKYAHRVACATLEHEAVAGTLEMYERIAERCNVRAEALA